MFLKTWPVSRKCLAAAIIFSATALWNAGCATVGPTSGGPVVSIVKGDDADKMVAEALELIGGLKGIVRDGQTVVIKPNLVTPAKAERPGLMTDVRVVAALVKRIQHDANCRIIIAEGSASNVQTGEDTMQAFKGNGYADLVKRYGVELKDLNKDERVKVKPAGTGYEEYQMPKLIQTCDVLIDVPLLKTHHLTGITVGMKNLFGLMPLPKARFHGKLNELLCDLIRIRRPDLTVVDGLVGTEGQGPLEGTAVRMDLVIAGRDIVAVDSVAAAVMGYEPARIPCLALAAKSGLGETDLGRIVIKGKPIESVKRLFAYARRDARITVPKTDELAKKILSLADRTSDMWGYRWAIGKTASFKAERLQPDTKKYPLRKSYGFVVNIPDRDDTIELSAPYEVIFPENGQAAVEEMRRWMEQNLGLKEKGTAATRPVGAN